MGKADVKKVREKATMEMPAELKELIAKKAGTRAKVLDLRELRTGNYSDLKQGYVSLKSEYDGELDRLFDPEECTERCIRGFHFAFDSESRPSYGGLSRPDENKEAKVYYVCTDPKCVAKKKAALTRAKNAAGQEKKKAETKAIKEATVATTTLDKPRMKLIILSQLAGRNQSVGHSYSSGMSNREFWLSKLQLPKQEGYNFNAAPIFEAIDKLSNEEVAKLIVEFTLCTLTYEGEIQGYKTQTTEALNWLGIGINVPELVKE